MDLPLAIEQVNQTIAIHKDAILDAGPDMIENVKLRRMTIDFCLDNGLGFRAMKETKELMSFINNQFLQEG